MVTQKYEHSYVPRGVVLKDINIDRLDLKYCGVDIGLADQMRPRLENCHIGKLKVRRSNLGFSILRNVEIDGMDNDVESSFLIGNEYYGVTIVGKVKRGLIFRAHPNPTKDGMRKSYKEAILRAEKDPDWRIDISQMEGRISVRGYNADGFIINPDYQCIIRNNPETLEKLKNLNLKRTLFDISIGDMVDNGWENTILGADINDKNAPELIQRIQTLRQHGIAE